MNLTPLVDRLIVERLQQAVRTNSGIWLSAGTPDEPDRGTVLACGPNVQDVAPGDAVLFSRHAGQAVVFNRRAVLVLRQEDVVAVLE